VTFEPLARALGLTTSVPPLPQPLSEYGVRRRLGADILEYTVSPADAVVGKQVRDLGLPPEVTVNTIVRHDELIQPRGPTRLNAGDELHLVVTGGSAARLVPGLLERWRNPGWQPNPPARRKGRQAWARRGGRVATGAWDALSGDPSNPGHVGGARVIQRLRVRRGLPGALVALDGGELALTGASFAIGDASQLRTYAMRRAAMAPEGADAAWWREVVETLKS
jgi:cell volume regulation protein A